MKKIFAILMAAILLVACRNENKYAGLETALQEFVAGKDARIGVAIIIDGTDTVSVNGNEDFPMLSVYKFPIAIAVAEHCRNTGKTFSDSCLVTASDLHRDTYSPMLERYGDMDTAKISYAELLDYALKLSDNNASDILLRETGGAAAADGCIAALGIDRMKIRWSEDEMYADTGRCYDNSSTPLAAAALAYRFDREATGPLHQAIKQIMENCSTGAGRLPAGLPTGAVIGHKTGTGFELPGGRLMAVNDVGYVHLPDGRHYSIAVLIADSGLDMASTEQLISEISSLAYQYIQQ